MKTKRRRKRNSIDFKELEVKHKLTDKLMNEVKGASLGVKKSPSLAAPKKHSL